MAIFTTPSGVRIDSETGQIVSGAPVPVSAPVPVPTPTPTPTPIPTPTRVGGLSAKDREAVIKAGIAGGLSREQATASVGGGLSAADKEAVIQAAVAGGLSREEATRLSVGGVPVQKPTAQIPTTTDIGKLGTTIPAPISTTTRTPTLAEPQVGGIQEAFTISIQKSVDTARATFETRLKTEIADIDKRITDSQKNIEELTELEAEGIEDVGTLLEPFRAKLEEAERERLFVNKNFEENQRLTDELESLLTEGNELIRQQKEITGLGAIRNPRIDKTISDVNARAGVIQAVMNARNGQINQAFNMIDRTVAAINADKQDQLTYYNTLLNFFENEKDEQGKKLVSLSKDKKSFLNSQITLLKGDLQQAETNAQNIKDLMTDPDTASFMAKAGVTLNDSPAQVTEKIAKQTEFDGVGQAKLTSTERKKLEQAGLSDATRQRQLDFLFGKKTPTPTDVFENIRDASIKDIKTSVKQRFEKTFANKLILDLNDEQLREFLDDFQNVQNELNQSLDPVNFLKEWKRELGIKGSTGREI